MRVENGVFGNRALEAAGGPAGSLVTQRPPLRSAHSAPVSARPGHGASVPRFGAPSTELTKALTSIVATPTVASASLRAHLLLEFDASAETVVRAKHDELERIMRTLPGREATVFLVERYFTNVSWLFHHLHAPSFRSEVEHFHLMCDQGRQREVDPFWLALLLMVLCLALDSMHYSRSPLSLRTEVNGQKDSTPVGKETPLEAYTQEQLKALPERWFGASMRALKLAEFETVPRIRSIQVSRHQRRVRSRCIETQRVFHLADHRALYAISAALVRIARAAFPAGRLARDGDPPRSSVWPASARLESRDVSSLDATGVCALAS